MNPVAIDVDFWQAFMAIYGAIHVAFVPLLTAAVSVRAVNWITDYFIRRTGAQS